MCNVNVCQELSGVQLGSKAIAAAVERAGLPQHAVQEVRNQERLAMRTYCMGPGPPQYYFLIHFNLA